MTIFPVMALKPCTEGISFKTRALGLQRLASSCRSVAYQVRFQADFELQAIARFVVGRSVEAGKCQELRFRCDIL
eukprot:420715-Amphidinium_carterae.1